MAYKILVVDDEPLVVASVARMLESSGYEALQATRGIEALKLAKEKKPDLIILDVVMPQMDGFEVLKKLRSDPETKAIAVIMFTTKDNSEDIVRSMVDLGALDFIVKPFMYEELLDRLRVNIEKRQRMIEKESYEDLNEKIKKISKDKKNENM